ncbi:MAG: hypothetical protein GX550_02505 [Syntrophomonadaceae bacterium]|nr:hypothetical protein [Syntrophomonadaceae bacterium]
MVFNLRKYKYLLVLILLTCITGYIFLGNNKEQPRLSLPGDSEPQVLGEWLAWNEVNPQFPKYSTAKVTDIDTGLQFNIARRGGTYHVDVQPLTARDTEVMKQIYNQNWSWKRRAVVVELENGKKIAGSMNGMPHGGGIIKNNNFDGHFCIHFRDSITHGSRKLDVAHQMMVMKAAGVIDEQLRLSSAQQLVLIFLAALDQKEESIFIKTTEPGAYQNLLLLELQSLESMKVIDIQESGDNLFQVRLRKQLMGSNQQMILEKEIMTLKKGGQWEVTRESVELLLVDDQPHNPDEKA